jgi:hypothetical protein
MPEISRPSGDQNNIFIAMDAPSSAASCRAVGGARLAASPIGRRRRRSSLVCCYSLSLSLSLSLLQPLSHVNTSEAAQPKQQQQQRQRRQWKFYRQILSRLMGGVQILASVGRPAATPAAGCRPLSPSFSLPVSSGGAKRPHNSPGRWQRQRRRQRRAARRPSELSAPNRFDIALCACARLSMCMFCCR